MLSARVGFFTFCRRPLAAYRSPSIWAAYFSTMSRLRTTAPAERALASTRRAAQRTHFHRDARDARGRATGEAMTAPCARPTRPLRGTGVPTRAPARTCLPAPGRARRGRRRDEELKIWNPGNLGVRDAPAGFQIPSSPTRARSRTAPAGLRPADALIALASSPCLNSRCRAVKRA